MRYHVQPDLKDAAKRTIQIGLSLSRGRMAQHTRLSEKGKGRPGWTASRSVVTYTTDLFRHNWPDHYQRSRPVTSGGKAAQPAIPKLSAPNRAKQQTL